MGGRPPPRSVDSQIKRRVIEPRNFLVVSPRLGQSRGPRQAAYTWSHTSLPGHAGVGEQGEWSRGILWELGRPCRLHRAGRTEIPAHQLRFDPRSRDRGRWGRTTVAAVVSPSEGNEARRDGRQGVAVPHSTVEAGEPTRGTPWRERSEANCLTSGCKSRRRRSPCGAVVISGSSRGDPRAGSPEVKAPGGQVDTEPPRSGQHRGQATRRAVAKANGLNAEIGSPHEADSSGESEMPRLSSLSSMASADAEG